MESLKRPDRSLTVAFPVETEDGTVQNFVGSYGRREATARGCLISTQRLLARGAVPGLISVDDATVVVQGYGNAGSIAAQLFCEAGDGEYPDLGGWQDRL